MTRNWMRDFELQLLTEEGRGLQLNDFKVEFVVSSKATAATSVASVTIYNLHPDTRNRILLREFSQIKLFAGYQTHDGASGSGMIFSGDIRFTLTGKTAQVDSWVKIQAISGHQAYLYATVEKTLAAGYRVRDVHQLAAQSFGQYGISAGATGIMPDMAFPRGRTLWLPARQVMENVAGQCDASWQLSDGQLRMVPETNYVHEAVLLNSRTGLLGTAQQTLKDGVNVQCLINPNIRLNGLVQLDQASVQRVAYEDATLGASKGPLQEVDRDGVITRDGVFTQPVAQPAALAADGVYIVKAIEWHGDTRGQDWYMTLTCEPRGARELQSE
ncbi:phage protein [Cronobacter dublinensis]|uniref:phage protein n=1 Tax=Cronobacter dublinensis TaxID=413497 RepID=UPI000CFE2544|nr:hypothetical protein [Cronobacter dublinensis]ELY9423064.1 hypothetical protein [Cronobacter dublinensis]